jgi:hypothetical protein
MDTSRKPKPSIALPAEARELLDTLIARGVTTEEIATGSDASGSLIRRMRHPENTGGRQAVRTVLQTLVVLTIERAPDLVDARRDTLVALARAARMDQLADAWATLTKPSPAADASKKTRKKRAEEGASA